MTIQNFITKYTKKNPLKFHTPGHKGALFKGDITELLDDSFPNNLIAKAQEQAASFYGVKRLRFLTGGSSIGIKAAILACGGDIITFNGAHQAIQEGCNLAKTSYQEYDLAVGDDGLVNLPTADTVAAAIKKYPSAKAIYIESPDYYGRVVDSGVVEVIKNAGKLFFCDAAHGAHFAGCKKLLPLSLEKHADAANLSAHKTLQTLTGGAFLCINNESLFYKIDIALKNLGTTSPNYLILNSLEIALEKLAVGENAYKQLYIDILNFKKHFECLPNIDYTRIVINTVPLGHKTAKTLANALVQNHNIYCEKQEKNWLVLITTTHNTATDFDKLKNAIQLSIQ